MCAFSFVVLLRSDYKNPYFLGIMIFRKACSISILYTWSVKREGKGWIKILHAFPKCLFFPYLFFSLVSFIISYAERANSSFGRFWTAWNDYNMHLYREAVHSACSSAVSLTGWSDSTHLSTTTKDLEKLEGEHNLSVADSWVVMANFTSMDGVTFSVNWTVWCFWQMRKAVFPDSL